MIKHDGPKVLIVDIETAPMLGYMWGLWDQNVGLNQIKSDWHILSWAAKWLDKPAILYKDQRNTKNIEDDSKMLKDIWNLLDKADIVITQNGKAFDSRKLNARFILNGMKPPSSYQHIDIFKLTKKTFAFSSHKLEYMTSKLNKAYKKLANHKYPGFELWKECISGNLEAWEEMEKYNKYDILSLEELYHTVIPWLKTVNFNLYSANLENKCTCGSSAFRSKGYRYSAEGKYRRLICKKCGKETRGSKNLFTKEKRSALNR